MKIKKFVLLIIFLNLFSGQFVYGTVSNIEDEIVVKQVVDNSCNENDLCEAELNETIYTCPRDCSQGNGNPATWQANAEAEGGPIEIYNLTIVVEDKEVTISWETNKPTNAILILEDGLGGVVGTYVEELFVVYHSVQIKDLDFGKNYYFKIFSEGIYGDSNYETARLYLMTPIKIEEGKGLEKGEENLTQIGEVENPLEKPLSYLISEVKNEPEKWSGTIPTGLSSSTEATTILNHYSDLKNSLFLNFKKILKDWWFPIMLFLGIIHFIYLIFRGEEDKK